MKLHLPALHYNLGHVLYQQGDLLGSIAAYQQAIQLDPSFAQAHHSLAVSLGAQGQYTAAIDHYRQVIALQAGAVKAYNNIGCIWVEQGQIEAALQVYQQAIALQPDWAVLHINLGKAMAAQDPIAAIAAYRRAIQLQPDLISAHYNLAQTLRQQGQQAAALEQFEYLFRLDPSHTAAHTECALLYSELGEWQQAFSHLRQAAMSQQDSIQAFSDWADQLEGEDELTLARKASSQFVQALLHTEASPAKVRSSKVLSLLKAAVAIGSRADQRTTRQALAQTYFHWGNLLMHYGGARQLQQAEIYYQRALQLQPQTLDLYLKLVQCLGQQRRWNAALVIGRLALINHPNAAQLYRSMGWILEQQQRWLEAISYYQQALQIEPFKYQGVTTASDSTDSALRRDDIKGIYQTTLSWVSQKASCQYIALEPNFNRQLIPRSVTSIDMDAPHAISSDASTCALANHSDCDGLNCHRCLKRIFTQFAPSHLGRGLYACEAKDLVVPPLPYFVAEIPDAQAWVTPYQTPWMVANSVAVLTPDRYLLADVSREYPGQLPGCCQSQSSFERIFQEQNQTKVEQITGRVAVLAGLSGHNYFHWMVDVLPRFELLRRGGIDLTEIDWFWINSPDAAFQQETLHRLGIPTEKILASDRHPQIQAEQLIVPSFAGHLGWLEPWALTFLRQQFLSLASPEIPHYERIYISRAHAHHRRLLNEGAVLDCLHALGFVSVELESLSLAEQIALFAHAKAIIAPHGGGLTNTIFCTPRTTIIEFFAPSYIRHYYWVISQHLGLHHYFIQGKEIACAPIQNLMYPSPLMEDIWVDLDALQAMLTHLHLK